MFTFKNDPEFPVHCPICGTAEPEDAVLVPVAEKVDGSNAEAIQVHTQCILQNAWFHESHGLIVIQAK